VRKGERSESGGVVRCGTQTGTEILKIPESDLAVGGPGGEKEFARVNGQRCHRCSVVREIMQNFTRCHVTKLFRKRERRKKRK
jgi:hypothetical protein